MGVYLREKKLGNGQVSFYLDIYHNKKRRYEFLNICINKNRPTEQDKEKRKLAQQIRSQRENELIVQDNGLQDKSKRKADFIAWFETYAKGKQANQRNNLKTLKHLQTFANGKLIPFHSINPDWIKEFSKFMLNRVSNNCTIYYLKTIFTALEEAVRKDIIYVNPMRKIPRHERLKLKPIFRSAFTIDELQKLWETPYNIEVQYKQAYLFSCFTGLRWSDVNPLRWSEIITKMIDGQEEWFIYFEQEKTEDIEYLPLSPQAVEILQERKKEQEKNKDKSLFVFPKAKEIEGTDKIYKKVSYSLKLWAEAAGIEKPRMHFHTGRHTFATNVLENSPEGDLWTVSKLLGHKSISATQIYAHVRDQRKTNAVKALPNPNDKFHFIFIDSLDTLKIDAPRLRELREHYPQSGFITISQSTKDGKMRGSQEIIHDTDIAAKVEDGVAITSKNRYHPRGTEFQVFSTQEKQPNKTMIDPRNTM
ncbi:MAG: tyrosine-type recombinase/integrase [Flavobacteriales bacterium]